MEAAGVHVLKLNIGNPAPFGFRAPDEVIYDMKSQLTECEGYSQSKGLFSARKAIMQYMQNNDMDVNLLPIAKPDKVFENVLAPLEIAAEHERYVTALINNIYHEAHQAKDYRTMKFLDWFVDEQMEEEDNADSMVSRYKLFGADAKGLYLLDQEYATRVYTAPSLVL